MKTRGTLKKGARGSVILTALFLVIVMFGLISATILKVQFTQGMTRDQVQKAQAVYLAKAGLNLGLSMLNNGETLPTGNSLTIPFGDDKVQLSIEPQPEPDLLHLVSKSQNGKHEHTSRVVVRIESGEYEGAVFARGARGASGTDALYMKKGGGTEWESLKPPPRTRLHATPLGGPGPGYIASIDPTQYPENFQHLEATENGQLFGIYKRDAGQIDTVYRLDMKKDEWSHLEPPKTYAFDSTSGHPNANSSDQFDLDLGSMASTGSTSLYVSGKSADGQSDVIHHYNLDKNEWEVPLPRPPHFNLDLSTGATTGQSGFAKNLKHLSVDGEGNVYAVEDRTVGTGANKITRGVILKYDGTEWTSIVPREKITFDDGQFTPNAPESRYADHINQIAVNQAGEIFARGVNKGDAPDTLYHFNNDGWTVVPPPKRMRFHRSDSDLVDDEPPKDYSDVAVDSEGRLYLRENRNSKNRYDSVYVYTEGEFSYLPQPKSEYYQGNSLTPDYQMGIGNLMNDLSDVTAGSHPLGEADRYVPTAEF